MDRVMDTENFLYFIGDGYRWWLWICSVLSARSYLLIRTGCPQHRENRGTYLKRNWALQDSDLRI